ncbi:MAG: hypothetical protein JWM16_4187 [Verrucomicrobiales bacterium]|nr:hypothetical protein [Verrucomicrobiales bacterium]
MNRKTRSDSKLDNLPPNQRETLERWLFDDSPRLSCAAAMDRLWEDFGVRSSETAVRSFYRRAQRARLEEEALENVVLDAKSTNRLLEQSEQNAADYTKAILTVISGVALKKAMRGEDLSVQEMATISGMALGGMKEDRERYKVKQKDKQLLIEERKLAILEAKAKAVQAVEETAKGGKIDAATKAELLAAIDRKLVGA